MIMNHHHGLLKYYRLMGSQESTSQPPWSDYFHSADAATGTSVLFLQVIENYVEGRFERLEPASLLPIVLVLLIVVLPLNLARLMGWYLAPKLMGILERWHVLWISLLAYGIIRLPEVIDTYFNKSYWGHTVADYCFFAMLFVTYKFFYTFWPPMRYPGSITLFSIFIFGLLGYTSPNLFTHNSYPYYSSMSNSFQSKP